MSSFEFDLFAVNEVPYRDDTLGSNIHVKGKICKVVQRRVWRKVRIRADWTFNIVRRLVEEVTRMYPVRLFYVFNGKEFVELTEEHKCFTNLFTIRWLKYEEPTDIKTIIVNPRKEFRNFEEDILYTASYVKRYIETIENRRVLPNVKPGFYRTLCPEAIPEEPTTIKHLLEEFECKIAPGLTNWQHPEFYAFYPVPTTSASLLGNILDTAFTILTSTWSMSPAAVELEILVLDWLGKLLGLPAKFLTHTKNADGGGMTRSSHTEGLLYSLCVAREQALDRTQVSDRHRYKVYSKLVAYTSEQGHSTHEKAFNMAILRFRKLDTDHNGSIRGATLIKALKLDIANGYIPFFLCATFGTPGILAFDNVEELGPVCKKYSLWLHVDMAYAGNALLCPELRHEMRGLEWANSIAINPYKWIGSSIEISCLYTKNFTILNDTFALYPQYLKYKRNRKAKPRIECDFAMSSISINRPMRGVRLWFMLRLRGLKNIQDAIRNDVVLAHYLEKKIHEDRRFEVINAKLGFVCFRLIHSNEANEHLLRVLNKSGEVYLVACMFRDKLVLRMVFGNTPNATEQDVDKVWNIIISHLCTIRHGSLKGRRPSTSSNVSSIVLPPYNLGH